MPLSNLREYLDKHEIKYVVISHSVAYTAHADFTVKLSPSREMIIRA